MLKVYISDYKHFILIFLRLALELKINLICQKIYIFLTSQIQVMMTTCIKMKGNYAPGLIVIWEQGSFFFFCNIYFQFISDQSILDDSLSKNEALFVVLYFHIIKPF